MPIYAKVSTEVEYELKQLPFLDGVFKQIKFDEVRLAEGNY